MAKRENGRAYLLSKKDHGGDHNPDGVNQYTIESSSGQLDYLSDPKTVEVVAEKFGVSPTTVQRATEFVKVLDEIKEKNRTVMDIIKQLIYIF